MADGLTTNLSFTLPEVGASDDTWGTKLNANWSALDALFSSTTLKHENGGLEADVSAYSGLIKITGGATSAVTITAAGEALLDDANASAQRTTLGLVIGTNVQAYDADLTSWAGVTRASGFDTFAATPSSANLASLLTDETGSGAAVFGTSPAITTPTITNPTFADGMVVDTETLSGTTPALDPASGLVQEWTLTANSTPTDSLADGESIVLLIDDGTAYTITWPTITWLSGGGSAPTLQTSGKTVVHIFKVGTTLYGNALNGA